MPEYNKQFCTKSAISMAINNLCTIININKFDIYDKNHFKLYYLYKHVHLKYIEML